MTCAVSSNNGIRPSLFGTSLDPDRVHHRRHLLGRRHHHHLHRLRLLIKKNQLNQNKYTKLF